MTQPRAQRSPKKWQSWAFPLGLSLRHTLSQSTQQPEDGQKEGQQRGQGLPLQLRAAGPNILHFPSSLSPDQRCEFEQATPEPQFPRLDNGEL